jgi:hypothetical protein
MCINSHFVLTSGLWPGFSTSDRAESYFLLLSDIYCRYLDINKLDTKIKVPSKKKKKKRIINRIGKLSSLCVSLCRTQVPIAMSSPPPKKNCAQKFISNLSRLRIFYRFIWIYSDLFDRGFVSKSLSLDMIRSCHMMCHVTYKPFVQWHMTLGESCHSRTDICDWIDKPRA